MKQSIIQTHVGLSATVVFLSLTLATPSLAEANKATASANAEQQIPLKEIRNFVDTYQLIRKNYVQEISAEALMDKAISGMLAGLDPHSVYLKKSEIESFNKQTTGEYVGIGVKIDLRSGTLIVISPFKGSPADKAGILAGDKIIKINGELLDKKSVEAIDALIKGRVGEKITLTILRGNDKPFDVEVTREKVDLPSVVGKMIDGDIAYFSISEFQIDTGEEFGQAAEKLFNDNKTINGIVLDLRNNPGGLIDSAIKISNYFLDEGLIVNVKNVNTDNEEKVYAEATPKRFSQNVVVLINNGSASASELVTAALQDHRRAIIVGEKSYGKGSVQTLMPLQNGDMIKLTTALYYSPNGYSIQATGITPDIYVTPLQVKSKVTNQAEVFSEKNVPRHLTTDKHTNNRSFGADIAIAEQDFQLYEAINTLKTLNFYQQQLGSNQTASTETTQ